MGTPYVHSEYMITSYIPLASRNKRKAIFMKHLKKNEPKVIIDAVAPGNFAYTLPDVFGPSTFPEFKEYIDKYYNPIILFPNGKLYLRK